MKEFFKSELFFWIVLVYASLSILAGMIRLAEMDCVPRYADYVFPLSKINCEIK